MRDRSGFFLTWRPVARAWPGLVSLISLLAVLLGTAPTLPPDSGGLSAAGRLTPALPELRPASPPGAPVPMTAGTPPEPLVLPTVRLGAPAAPLAWQAPLRRPRLSELGRRQTDGG
ncbi:hypothetical protein [Deinococcus multiflagellatus]|uniref:hypothetical protein n=1 Tax=Deinococcus multiflagellatus TaxID=1656887 RepID=UPI001CCF67E0|nr:hypothetical protein [Deinococcus multiflagellatus]MBZ9711896.1 hypothetical protein [Deinococcus multiflagellatus]